jgi:2'-deoxynucleoside 5'-phosphate N-hydrolase
MAYCCMFWSLMPVTIFLSIKYHPDASNHALIEQILAILAGLGLNGVCVVRDIEHWGNVRLAPDELMRATFAELRSARLLLVEATEKGVGVGIEAGYATARGVPLVAVARQGSEISPTLSGIARASYLYSDLADLAEFLRTHLQEWLPIQPARV